MTEVDSWKRYLTPEAARRPSYEDLAADRAHEMDAGVRRMRIIKRAANLSALIAAAEDRGDQVEVERLLDLRNAVDDELDRLDEGP